MKKSLFFILFLLVLTGSFYYTLIEHESSSLSEQSLVINKPYISVVKSLATKESLEKIVEENDGILRSKQWQNFTIDVPKRILKIKEYKLEGVLYFTVEKHDKDLGEIKLPFEQNVNIDKNIFVIKTNLKESQKNVKAYNKIIEIYPSKEEPFKTSLNIKSELKVSKIIPFFFKDFMDKKVKENNEQDLNKLINNIRSASQDTSPVITFKTNW